MPIRRNAVPVASRASSARAAANSRSGSTRRARQPRRARAQREARRLQLQHHAAGRELRSAAAAAPASRPAATDAAPGRRARVRSASNVVSALIDLVSRAGSTAPRILAARAPHQRRPVLAEPAHAPRASDSACNCPSRVMPSASSRRASAGPTPGSSRTGSGASSAARLARRSPRSRAACRARRRSWPAAGSAPGRSRR